MSLESWETFKSKAKRFFAFFPFPHVGPMPWSYVFVCRSWSRTPNSHLFQNMRRNKPSSLVLEDILTIPAGTLLSLLPFSLPKNTFIRSNLLNMAFGCTSLQIVSRTEFEVVSIPHFFLFPSPNVSFAGIWEVLVSGKSCQNVTHASNQEVFRKQATGIGSKKASKVQNVFVRVIWNKRRATFVFALMEQWIQILSYLRKLQFKSPET